MAKATRTKPKKAPRKTAGKLAGKAPAKTTVGTTVKTRAGTTAKTRAGMTVKTRAGTTVKTRAGTTAKTVAKRPPGRPKGSTGKHKTFPGPAIDKAWFIGRLKDVRKSMRALARFMEVEASTISLMFSGKRKMRLDEAESIARFLDVTVEDVLRHAGVRSLTSEEAGEARLVPVAGRIDGRGKIVLKKPSSKPGTAKNPPETVTGPAGLPAGAIAVVGNFGSDTAGELALLDGAYFFYVPSKDFKPGAVGRLSVVQIGGRSFLRRVLRSDDPDQFELDGFGEPSRVAEIDAATPILWIRA